MPEKKNLIITISRLSEKAKRIFNISYEDLSAQIYYDVKNTFKLIIVRNNEQLLPAREISRAEAFRIMNTRL